MRKKRNNITKISLLFIILLLSLASISYSYAAWYDTIYIDGTVNTGEWLCEETAWARMYNDPEDFTYEFPGDNWATYIIHKPTCDPETFYLYADQHYRAGELYVWRDANHLYVEYDLDDGITMSETHLHIAKKLCCIPQKNGNPIPGQFDYKAEHDPEVNSYLYTIPWNPCWTCKTLYIAAHAVVWGSFGDCIPCPCEC